MERNMLYLAVCFFITLSTTSALWSFNVVADWHGAETFSHSPVTNDTYSNDAYNEAKRIFTNIKHDYGGDLFILTGDTNVGKWHTENFEKKLIENLPFLTDEERQNTVATAGTNCYSTIQRLFNESGYEKVLVSIGDHELGKFPQKLIIS